MAPPKVRGNYVMSSQNMSDERLRWELTALGFTPGPITDSTREVLKKKLQKLRIESTKKRANNGNHSGSLKETNGQYSRRSWAARSGDCDEGDCEEDEDDIQTEGKHWSSNRIGFLSRSHGLSGRSVDGDSWGVPSFLREEHGVDRREALGVSAGTQVSHRRSLGANRDESALRPSSSYARNSLGGLASRYAKRTLEEKSRSSFPDEYTQNTRFPFARDELTSHYQYDDDDTPKIWLPAESGLGHRCGSSDSWDHCKQSWARTLEYYLSRVLWGLSVLLGIIFIGILVAKSGVLTSQQENGIKLLPSYNEGCEDPFCKAKQKKITFEILSELYDFLSVEAGRFECGNPGGLTSKCVPISTARAHITNVSGHSSEKFDAALEWMINNERHLGIWVKGEDATEIVTSRDYAACVESSRPRLGVFCRLKNALRTAISTLFLALLGVLVLWLILVIVRYHWRKLEEEEKLMFEMVEKIIDAVKSHYKEWSLGNELNPYIGIVHVRDTLIPPQDRKRMRKVWEHAVQFVEDNESRLRTESQRVAGADLRVWRWAQIQREHAAGGPPS
ncbi:LEM domain-containing protein 2 [Spea bombifrons]|uniref:LEM domain-containing protein 2 n=1 Tax=Spea bombifrons TaxID=233779 RepID=UPI00234B5DC7|nr:LEM domain-containing protein 2 [Spea bombifrons]